MTVGSLTLMLFTVDWLPGREDNFSIVGAKQCFSLPLLAFD